MRRSRDTSALTHANHKRAPALAPCLPRTSCPSALLASSPPPRALPLRPHRKPLLRETRREELLAELKAEIATQMGAQAVAAAAARQAAPAAAPLAPFKVMSAKMEELGLRRLCGALSVAAPALPSPAHCVFR